MNKPTIDEYSDEEAERRAIEAIRRSVTKRHVTQQEMIGKVGRKAGRKSKPVQKRQQKA
jgi:hypothetical protein